VAANPGPADAGLTICTPLRIERAAVVRGLKPQQARIVRLGMGPARTRERAAQLIGSGPVAVLGVAGGLAPDVRPGEIVVATEVSVAGGKPVPCHQAEALADAVRRTGLPVHLGPIVSTPHIVTGEEFDSLAASSGALAVDMESGYVAEMLGPDRPLAVVRAVSDTRSEPLFSPAILRRGVGALGAVRRAASVITEWADAARAN
jgi:4-hydroxy-3-methylbut-2-enyl diphosphate reductase